MNIKTANQPHHLENIDLKIIKHQQINFLENLISETSPSTQVQNPSFFFLTLSIQLSIRNIYILYLPLSSYLLAQRSCVHTLTLTVNIESYNSYPLTLSQNKLSEIPIKTYVGILQETPIVFFFLDRSFCYKLFLNFWYYTKSKVLVNLFQG